MTNQPEIKPCADAVEALAKSIAHTEWEYASPNPTSVIEHLATQGYTITRTEPAAPSSDEVDRDLCAVSMVFPETAQDLRAHIAALEADNKRLRGVINAGVKTLISTGHIMTAADFAKALVQTDGKVGE